MYKKILIIIILFQLTLFMSGYGCDTYVYYEIDEIYVLEQELDGFEYIDINYTNDLYMITLEDNQIHYFESLDDLKQINNYFFDNYDDTFFLTHNLVIITVKDERGNSFEKASGIDEELYFNRKINIYEDPTIKDTELTNFTIILEVKKEYKSFPIIMANEKEMHYIHNHNWLKFVIEPTCQLPGYTLYKCACGKSNKDDYKTVVDCKYENGKCIWCGKEEIIVNE